MASTPPSADTEEEEFEMVSDKSEEKPEEPKLRRKAVCEAEVRILIFLSVLISVYTTFCLCFCMSRPILKSVGLCFGLADRFLKSVGLECLYVLDWPTDF